MRLATLISSLLFCGLLGSCGPAEPLPVEPANILGRWALTSGNETEWFHFEEGGQFTARIQGRGFLSGTLSQGPDASISGSWELDGNTLRLQLTGSSDAALVGLGHICEIVELTDHEMTTEDPDGTRHDLVKGI